MSPSPPLFEQPWFAGLLTKLLEGDRPTLSLLKNNPFPDRPPRFVRARYYRYQFTTPAERRSSGMWWKRELIGDYVPPVGLTTRERARH
jgi:hypothetical protein